MKAMNIGRNEAGQRLDKYLAKVLAEAPKSFLYKMLRKKNITLNGKKASGNEILKEKDEVKFFLSDETFEKFSRKEFRRTRQSLNIIFENEDVLLINKPAGVLSQKQDAKEESMVEQMISYLLDTQAISQEQLRTFRPGICNRLDRNTSGLLIAGKTLPALQQLSDLIRKRSVHKYYLCLVKGVLKEKQSIKGYLQKDNNRNMVQIYPSKVGDAVFIETVYEPLGDNGTVTLCKVLLVTGRTHQIRSHLSSIGHPIIGDTKYGSASSNQYFKQKYGLRRQLLHAWNLEFPDMEPDELKIGGKSFFAPLPDDFSNILRRENLPEESIINGGKEKKCHTQ